MKTLCFGKPPGLNINFGNQTAFAPVVHRNRTACAHSLYRKENFVFMRIRLPKGNQSYGIGGFIINIIRILMLPDILTNDKILLFIEKLKQFFFGHRFAVNI